MVVNTRPRIPKGAQLITHWTIWERAPAMASMPSFTWSGAFLSARPKSTAQARIPM